MLGTNRRIWILIPAVVALAGSACSHMQTEQQIMAEQMEEAQWHSKTHLRDMSDSALVQDMSIADLHFVAHTTELNGTGVARLDRLAHFLEVYGGTVRYETSLTDEKVVNERMAHVREYLTMAGCNMDRVQVKSMMSGGRGMPADRAIQIHERGTQPTAEQKPAWSTGGSGGSEIGKGQAGGQ